MNNPSTRRAALGAILAAPLATSPAAAVIHPDLSPEERRFLELGPWLRSILPEAERRRDLASKLYREADAEAGGYPLETTWERLAEISRKAQSIRDTNGYHEAWNSANELQVAIAEAAEDLMESPMTTLDALAMKAWVSLAFDCWQDDVVADLAALAGRARECV